jgi:hypothetical protein
VSDQSKALIERFQQAEKLSTKPPAHQWVVKQAYLIAQPTLPVEAQDEIEHYLDNVVAGAKHEDEEALKGDFILPLYGPMPFLSHYWNPDKPKHGFLGWSEICIDRVNRRWKMATMAYAAGKITEAYDQLGHVMHLLTDMSTPAHVHWDLHPFYDTYELGYLIEFNHQVPNGYNYQQWIGAGLAMAPGNTLEVLFESLARVAQQFDSNDAAGTLPLHSHGHSATREHQPLSSKLLLSYDVSYADAKVHAETCMPAAMSHVAAVYKMFWEQKERKV